MRPNILFFILMATALVLPMTFGRAQELNYVHYTTESGVKLPSNEVYRILFDKKGVLWATTDRGVWRYDGYASRQFTVSDGLKENSNLRIFNDSWDRIWVSSMNNYLYGIIDDTVRMHPASETIHSLHKSSEYVQHIFFNTDSTLYLSYNYPGLYLFKPGNHSEKQTKQLLNHEGASMAIHYDSTGYYFDMIGLPDTNQRTRTDVVPDKEWIYLKCGAGEKTNDYRKELYPIGKNEFIVSYVNKVFHIKDGRLKSERAFDDDITSLFVDKKGSFWIGLVDEGAMLFLNPDFYSEPIHYLTGETVTGIAQDHEGSYWFSTLTNGIFEANTLDIEVYNYPSLKNKDNIITAMVSDGESIYLGTQTGLLLKGYEQVNHKHLFRKFNIPSAPGSIRKMFYTPDKHLLLFKSHLMEIDTSGQYQGVGKMPGYAYDYLPLTDGKWMVSFPANISVIKDSRIIQSWIQKDMDTTTPYKRFLRQAINRVRAFHLDNYNRIWLGSQNSGLLSSSDSIVYTWSKKDTLLGRRIHCINQVGKDIWASVADYGIAIIHPDSSVTRITQKSGLSSDIIDVLFVENDSVVWAGTNNGLNKITLDYKSQTVMSISYHTINEGLPSNRIYQIIKHKGDIWVATSQGAIRLKTDFINPPKMSPRLVIGPILVNEQPRKVTSAITLQPGETDLVIKFKATTYRSLSRVHYKYKMVGIDDGYIATDNLEARYADLRHGNYTFCINSSYTDTFDPFTEKTIRVEVPVPFLESKLMLAVYALLLAGLIYLIFIVILKDIKTRELEKRRLLHAEKRALLSQMNPHFIFNSLNSIEHFIIQHDEFQANNYLTNFSGLIRRILDNSKKNVITLQEEITTLCLYLGMEKLRFENEFENKINKDDKIDYNETMIPPMMLQPFVENAIWHGLLPLKGKGYLKISFADQEDYFKCSIEDNGIGRENSLSLKGMKTSHIPNGIKNVEERIELLNKMNKRKISLTISDLKHPDGTASGTLIELVIPYELKT